MVWHHHRAKHHAALFIRAATITCIYSTYTAAERKTKKEERRVCTAHLSYVADMWGPGNWCLVPFVSESHDVYKTVMEMWVHTRRQITRSGEYQVLKVARGWFWTSKALTGWASKAFRAKQYSPLAPWPVDFLHPPPLPRIGWLGTLHNRCTVEYMYVPLTCNSQPKLLFAF